VAFVAKEEYTIDNIPIVMRVRFHDSKGDASWEIVGVDHEEQAQKFLPLVNAVARNETAEIQPIFIPLRDYQIGSKLSFAIDPQSQDPERLWKDMEWAMKKMQAVSIRGSI
jgi:hypothetical protein